MPINDKLPKEKQNRSKCPEHKENCSELHISRIDLKRKNYNTSKTVEIPKAWQCNKKDRMVAAVLLLNQMWKERQYFAGGEEVRQ